MRANWLAVFSELERRKGAKEDPCDSCYGSGRSSDDTDSNPLACGHCLGQGVLLTTQEHEMLMEIARTGSLPESDALDAEFIQQA